MLFAKCIDQAHLIEELLEEEKKEQTEDRMKRIWILEDKIKKIEEEINRIFTSDFDSFGF